jgi:hypothetical protein
MPEITKVLYDVSQAIKELEKLNKKVNEAGDKANEAFEKGGLGAEKFDAILKKLPGNLDKTVTSARTLITTFGPSALVFGTAAAGIASIAANLLDLKTLLRDTTANYDAFIRATERIRQQGETISDFDDVAVERNLELAQRAVRLDKADLAEQQNLVEVERESARRRLEIVQDEIRQRGRIVQDGLKREEDLRKRLAERNTTNAADQFGGPAPKRVVDLAAAANRAAFEGNIDLAEELLNAAKEQSAELGNHSFFLKAIDSANSAINSQLEKQIQSQSNVNKEGQKDLSRLQQLEAALGVDIEKNEEKLRVIQRQNRELSRQIRLLRDASLEQRNLDTADTAAKSVQTASKNVFEFFRSGPSFLEDFSKTFDSIQQAVLGGAGDQAATDTIQAEAIRELSKVAEVAARVNRGEAVTPTDIGKLIPSLEKVGKLGEILQVAEDQGRVPKGSEIENQINALQSAIDQSFKLLQGAQEFRRVRGDETAIQPGTTGPSRDDMRALRDSILKLNDTLGGAPSRASAAIQAQTTATSQGAPPPINATAASQNITVNANVKGGIIDAEVTREITRIIREELRKGTSAAPVA